MERYDFLPEYVARQINYVCPDDHDVRPDIRLGFETALNSTVRCIDAFREYRENGFDYLVSWQYATFIYFLAHTIWAKTGQKATPTRLFLLNKVISGIDLFYEIKLPPVFSLTHTLGTVFSKATYGNYGVYYHGCTIGRHGVHRPVLENGVVMMPGAKIIGDCVIRENTVLAPGVALVNISTPGNCYVFQGKSGRPIFKDMNKYYADLYFVRDSG